MASGPCFTVGVVFPQNMIYELFAWCLNGNRNPHRPGKAPFCPDCRTCCRKIVLATIKIITIAARLMGSISISPKPSDVRKRHQSLPRPFLRTDMRVLKLLRGTWRKPRPKHAPANEGRKSACRVRNVARKAFAAQPKDVEGPFERLPPF